MNIIVIFSPELGLPAWDVLHVSVHLDVCLLFSPDVSSVSCAFMNEKRELEKNSLVESVALQLALLVWGFAQPSLSAEEILPPLLAAFGHAKGPS